MTLHQFVVKLTRKDLLGDVLMLALIVAGIGAVGYFGYQKLKPAA